MPYMTKEKAEMFIEATKPRVRMLHIEELSDQSDRTLAIGKEWGEYQEHIITRHVYLKGGMIHIYKYLTYTHLDDEIFDEEHESGIDFDAAKLNVKGNSAENTDEEFAHIMFAKNQTLKMNIGVADDATPKVNGFYEKIAE